MRNTVLMLLIGTLQVFATGSYAQTKTISLAMKDATIREVLYAIQNQSEFYFLYNSELIDVAKKVNITIEEEKVDEILTRLFDKNEVDCLIRDRYIVLTPVGGNAELFDQRSVSGRVTDAFGQPLPGVTVVIKGSTQGTISDGNGNFSLNNVPENAILVFSFVGMKTQEIAVADQTKIDVRLEVETIGIEEVIAVGYGVTRKSDLTGSVSSVTSADFEKQPIIRVEDALKGRAAGVQVQKPSGAPGAGMKIRIRGANSINGSNDPLYVVDGFVGADIISLNPNEIASISILKDASSTAIYGSRGANGVVLITTKSAKSGDAKIEFDAFYSLDQISNTYDLLGPVEYMETINARMSAIGSNPQFSANEISEVALSGGTNWQDEVFRNGGTQNYQLSLSGGNENTQYYLSGSIADQTGIILNSFYKRYGLRTNINSKLRENFDIAFTMFSTYEESRNNSNHNGRADATGSALIFAPNIPVWDESDNNYTQSPPYGPIASNPVFLAMERIFDNKEFKTISNLKLNYEIVNGLMLSISGGANGFFANRPFLKTAAPGSPKSITEAGHNNNFSWNLQNTNMLNYSSLFADKHRLDVSAIYEQQVFVSRYNGNWATGFPTIALGYDNVGLGDTRTVGSNYSNWSLQSYLGRLNYIFNEKYLFTATFRADGSSKFYGDNKYGFFPSGALAWRMSDEPFIRDISVIQNLKLRTSYGITGSQAIAPYKTLSLLSLGQNYSFDGSTNQMIGIAPGVAANPDLKWETTAQTNFGLDFGIFEGRLAGSIDYYHKKTTDLLLDVKIPDYSGGGSLTKNVGSLENKGIEFLLSGIIADQSKFKLNTSFNFSANRNKILDLGDETEIYTDGGYTSNTYAAPPFILKVGEPLGQFRGLVFDGLWQQHEADAAAEYGLVPGDSKYIDVDNNKSYGGEDMMQIGSAQPDFTWGWNTSVQYGNFDLSVYVNGVHGNDVWNQTRWLIIGMGTDVESPTSVDILNRWTPENTNTTVAGFSKTNTTYAQSSLFVEDGSFIRLNNITLGYTLPQNRILKNKLKNARLYVSAQNLFVITNYSGIDPELSSTPGWSDIAQGIDNGTYPATRTFTVGLKIGF